MSFEIKLGPNARRVSQSAKFVLFSSILCGLSCLQAEAAPLIVAKPAAAINTHQAFFRHRSIWAVKWAAAHPAQEAAYLAHMSPSHRRFASHGSRIHVSLLKTAAAVPEAAVPVTPLMSNVTKHTINVAAAQAPALKPATSTPVVSPVMAPLTPLMSNVVKRENNSDSVTIAPAINPVQIKPAVAAFIPAPVVALKTIPAVDVASDTSHTSNVQPAPIIATVHQHRTAEAVESINSDVTLDFVAADINDVLKALSVQTRANIVSGADVKGTITVSLSHVTLDEALDMITRLSGFQYSKVGSTYVIGTAAGILSLTGSGADHESVSTVVTYNYATYADLSAILKERFPDLKISDSNSSSSSKDSQYKAMVLFGDPTYVAEARDMISQIDASLGASAANQTTVVYRVEYASMSDLITILGSLVPTLTVTPGPSQGFSSAAPAASSGSSSSSTGSSGGGGSSSGSSSSGGSSGSSSGSAAASIGADLLLLTGDSADISRAQQILGEVDVQPVQIEYDTKVTEVDINKMNHLGINWNFSGLTTTIGEEALGGSSSSSSSTTTSAVPGNNGQSNLLSFGAIGRTAIGNLATLTVDALITNGDAKLLSDPNIAALDGRAAQIFVGDTVNYVSSITQSSTGEDVTTASVQVGVILRVTGKVGADGYITLNIHPEVSEITGYLSVPGGGSLPQIANRFADTTVRVKNGETIAIGGLIQDDDTKSVNKVPGLGDLPFVGKLFQDNQDTKTRTEVVFLLTTKIPS